MDEIGSILRDAREMKGLTIAEVHENLRISKKYIVALEEGRYELLPSQTHVRGYLNKYARFLGLQADPLLERYEAVKQQRPVPPPAAVKEPAIIETPLTLPEPETGTFFAHANFELSNTGSPKSEPDWIGRLIVLALIIAIGLIGWRFMPSLLGEEDALSSENLSTAVLDLLNNDEAAADETLPENDQPSVLIDSTPVVSSSDLITSTSRTTGSTQSVDQAPPQTPTRSPLPATMESIDIQLDIVERSWVMVEVDGATVFEGQAQQGEVFNWQATDYVRLRTGNAAGTFVTINNIELGRLGERGQLADETWETTTQ